MELAHDLEGAEVVGHVEVLQGVGGVEDKVELELPWLVPALFIGGDELLGAHLEGVLLLAGAVGDGVYFGPKSLGPEQGKVTKTAAVRAVSGCLVNQRR